MAYTYIWFWTEIFLVVFKRLGATINICCSRTEVFVVKRLGILKLLKIAITSKRTLFDTIFVITLCEKVRQNIVPNVIYNCDFNQKQSHF